MKTFLSGRISGIEQEAKELFKAAHVSLEADGNKAINPFELAHDHDKDWRSYMIVCLRALLCCDEIYMIDGWQESKGAKVEHFIAKQLGMKVRYQSPPHLTPQLLIAGEEVKLSNDQINAIKRVVTWGHDKVRVDSESILIAVNNYYGVDIRSRGRSKPLPDAKKLFSYIMHQCNYGTKETANVIGVDHTTICHNLDKFQDYLDTNDLVSINAYNSVCETLKISPPKRERTLKGKYPPKPFIARDKAAKRIIKIPATVPFVRAKADHTNQRFI